MVKVLHIIGDLRVAGAQSVVMTYLQAFRHDSNYQFVLAVVSKLHDGSEYEREAEEKGYEVLYCHNESTNHPKCRSRVLNWINTQRELYRIIKKSKPDIIHTHITPLLPYVCIPVALSGVKHRVHTLHSDPYAIKSRFVPFAIISFRCLNFYPICVTESQATKAVKRYCLKRCTVIHNGIDLDATHDVDESRESIRASLGIPLDAWVIGFVGRLHMIKNLDFLIRVFSRLHESMPEARLLLIGEGEERKRIDALLETIGLSDCVFFLGVRTDLARMYKAMDIFALTSFYESSSIVTVEAQAAGLDCVISDNVPKDVVVTNHVCRLDLDAPEQNWIKALRGEGKPFPPSADIGIFDKNKCNQQLRDLYGKLLNDSV